MVQKNKCVRLELYCVGLAFVEGVAEWTERRRSFTKIQVRPWRRLVVFGSKSALEHFFEVDTP